MNKNDHFLLDASCNQSKGEQKIVSNLLGTVGIILNGLNPWDIQVYNPNFYSSMVNNGSLGLGESYMAGYWDSGSLDITLYAY